MLGLAGLLDLILVFMMSVGVGCFASFTLTLYALVWYSLLVLFECYVGFVCLWVVYLGLFAVLFCLLICVDLICLLFH